MTTFNISNIVPNLQEMTMTVFYVFSNGEINSNTVPANTPVTDILAWGQERCTWFDDREQEMVNTITEVLEANLE